MTAILITGGAGYIGSHVAWACVDAGRKVVVFDNLSTGVAANVPGAATFVKGDIADTKLLAQTIRAHDVSAVIHFAGSIVVPESVADPLKYYSNNTLNSLGLMRVVVEEDVAHVIFSSTAAVYAPTLSDSLSEDDPVGPINPYGWSKLMTEQMLADGARAYGFRFAALRYFNVAGADPQGRTGQSSREATHLIKVAAQAALGLRARISIYGDDYDTPDGTCVRDYIHVSDLAEAHLRTLVHLESGAASTIMNCGYGRGASVREVLDMVAKVNGAPLPVDMAPRRAGDPPKLIANAARLRAQVDWTPAYDDLETIVRDALAWERRCAETSSTSPAS